MSEDFIDYASLIDEAMHIIVKKSLIIAATSKLPGNHHFFISFLTKFPDVKISPKLHSKYPQEMTIVLQFQFDNLLVDDNGFSVQLSFDNVKEQVEVPFAAITAFADPSVKFGLQFRHTSESFSEDHDDDTVQFGKNNIKNKIKKLPDSKVLKKAIEESGSGNVITLDSFRKK